MPMCSNSGNSLVPLGKYYRSCCPDLANARIAMVEKALGSYINAV